MLKKKFAKAKVHIDAEEYDQAREILKTIDHPIAKKWRTGLDQIAPLPPTLRQRVTAWLMLIFIAVCIVGLAALLISINNQTGIMCGDGSISHAVHRQGACSGHGGIK